MRKKEFDEAEKYYIRCREVNVEIGDKRNESMALGRLVKIARKKNQLDRAKELELERQDAWNQS